MPHKRVAVVAAMRRELAPLLRGAQSLIADGVEFFELGDAVVAIGGVGRKAASRAADAAVASYQPGVIVSAGVAGALTATLKVGDVVQAREVVDADSGARFSTSEGGAMILTVSSVSGPEEKRILAERWKADMVDMEAAAVASVAQRHGIEFAAIKAVSDELNFAMPPVGEFVSDAGKFATTRFAAYVAIRPQWWRSVHQLSANSRLAAVNLSEALIHLIDRRSFIAPEQRVPGV